VLEDPQAELHSSHDYEDSSNSNQIELAPDPVAELKLASLGPRLG